MKVSREQAVENRERIVTVAAELFRERGFDGIGVADLMKAAGLTHGGFYGNFASKEDLMAQACAHAFDSTLGMWDGALDRRTSRPLTDTARRYLSQGHRAAPGKGCAAAAMSVDASRQGSKVRSAFTDGLRRQIEALASRVSGRTDRQRRQKSIAAYASLVGALVMARAVDDPALADEIMQAVQRSVASSD
jgi:TetR/AcrR family transcriptional repressor of nem operon